MAAAAVCGFDSLPFRPGARKQGCKPAPEAYAATRPACTRENPVRLRTGARAHVLMRSRGGVVPAGLISRRSWCSNPTSATQVRCQRRHARLPPWRTGFDSLYLHQAVRWVEQTDATVVQGQDTTLPALKSGFDSRSSHQRDEGLMVSRRFREPELCGFDSHHPDRWTEEVGLSHGP